MPAFDPFYPPLPAIYRNVKSYSLSFTARPEAVAGFLPAPLEPSPDGLCVACGMEIPYCSSYGAFLEAFLVLKCLFRGQPGYFCSHVFHDGPAGIAAGREIYGTPKVYSDLSLRQTDRATLTTASWGGVELLRLSTTAEQSVAPEALPDLTPAWRLKVIPRADGPGPAIKQLIDCTRTTRDLEIHYCARGKGTVTFGASAFADLTPLQPVSLGDAYYTELSYAEHYAEIAYDYLQRAALSEHDRPVTARPQD